MGTADKGPGRTDTDRLSPLARQVMNDSLTYLSAEKLLRIEGAIAETAHVAGDIVEFGVALGGSAIIFASHAGPSRRFLGFDVFGMIPPPTSEKDDAKSKNRYHTIRSGASEGIGGNQYYGYRTDLLADVKSAFRRCGLNVDGERVVLVKGLFEESWPATDISGVSLVHIDCDWYEPVKFCLEAAAEKMNPGGIIVIDDYYDYGGCRTAVDEFFASRSDFAFEDGRNPFLRRLS